MGGLEQSSCVLCVALHKPDNSVVALPIQSANQRQHVYLSVTTCAYEVGREWVDACHAVRRGSSRLGVGTFTPSGDYGARAIGIS